MWQPDVSWCNGHLMLTVMFQSPFEHVPHPMTIDLTDHIKECVRQVIAEAKVV
jgi:hypothetical protein